MLSDDFEVMDRQAREMSTWGSQVYVKIPITNTRREPSYALMEKLSKAGVRINATALMSLDQVKKVADCVAGGPPCYVSIFAGRVADTGRDPVPVMARAVKILKSVPQAELIWASPRELVNIFQADEIGCHVITVTNDILKKLSLVGKDLDDYSLETVKMFYDDAHQAGYKL